jgi:hypothetical protein
VSILESTGTAASIPSVMSQEYSGFMLPAVVFGISEAN